MNLLTSLFLEFGEYTRANPVLATMVSLWGLSVVTIVCRKIPTHVFKWFYGQITTTLELDNTELGWARENYAGFMQWYTSRKQVNFTRHFSVLSTGAQVTASVYDTGKAAVVAVGTGTHYFFYKRRLCKMSRRMLEKTGNENNIFVIEVTIFSRKRHLIQSLLDEFCFRLDLNQPRHYHWGASDYWSSDGLMRKRSLKTVVVNPQLKRDLIKNIEDFLMNQQWYYDRGFPWKKTFAIHGKPGGGKTSLIKALAAHFNMHVARINLSEMTDASLQQAISTAPERSIILIEDFDSADVVKTRESMKVNLQLKQKEENNEPSKDKKVSLIESSRLTLSGVLNALDGIIELDGKIIFLTTNVLHEIDPAVIRKGRVDKIYELPALTHNEVVEYIQLMFPHAFMKDFDITFDDIMGCDLQAIYFDHPDSVYDFIRAIPGVFNKQVIQQAA